MRARPDRILPQSNPRGVALSARLRRRLGVQAAALRLVSSALEQPAPPGPEERRSTFRPAAPPPGARLPSGPLPPLLRAPPGALLLSRPGRARLERRTQGRGRGIDSDALPTLPESAGPGSEAADAAGESGRLRPSRPAVRPAGNAGRKRGPSARTQTRSGPTLRPDAGGPDASGQGRPPCLAGPPSGHPSPGRRAASWCTLAGYLRARGPQAIRPRIARFDCLQRSSARPPAAVRERGKRERGRERERERERE